MTNCNGQSGTFTISPVKSVAIKLPKDVGRGMKNIASFFIRRIEQRSGAKASVGAEGELKIELSVDTGIGKDGFTIANGKNGNIQILGNNARAITW